MSRAARRPSRRQTEASRRWQAPQDRPKPSFDEVNRAVLARSIEVLARILPDGKRIGHEWISRNPKRADTSPGSFSVNVNTGRWADFAIGVAGGDMISLVAYLFDMKQGEAASKLATMVGVR